MRTDIFSYRNAEGVERWADPLAVERRFRTVAQEDPRKLFADLIGADQGQAMYAASRIPPAACHAFELGPPFDATTGQGVLESVWAECLRAWVEWMEKNALGGLTSPTCSEVTPVSPPSMVADSSI
jgi:hypothetical protein